MARLQTVRASAESTTVNEVLERDGCVVLEGLLAKDEILELESELNEHFENVPVCQGDFFGYATKRMSGILRKSLVSRKMAVLDPILAVMDHFLLPSCRAYQLNLTQAIQIGSGEPAQILHTDELLFPFDHPGRQAMINCMWAVTDFTAENGATIVIPGSHKWPADRQPEPHEVTQGVMSAGSVLLYFGGLLHAGGANRTQMPRTGLVLSYSLGWLRQVENHYLAIPLGEARTYPERLQRLIGYFVHEPNMGCVDGQDPISLLHGNGTENRRFEEFMPSEVKPMLKEHRAQADSTLFNDRKAYSRDT